MILPMSARVFKTLSNFKPVTENPDRRPSHFVHGILKKLVGLFTHVPNMSVSIDLNSKRLTTRRRKVRFADDVSDDEIMDPCRLHLVREVRCFVRYHSMFYIYFARV